jgi:hypothetical protein
MLLEISLCSDAVGWVLLTGSARVLAGFRRNPIRANRRAWWISGSSCDNARTGDHRQILRSEVLKFDQMIPRRAFNAAFTGVNHVMYPWPR